MVITLGDAKVRILAQYGSAPAIEIGTLTIPIEGQPIRPHVRTDPRCVRYEPVEPRSREDLTSRGLSCERCLPD